MNDLHARMASNGLVRPKESRVIAGVCAGVARRYGWDPTLVRVVFVVACLALPGSPVVLYPLLWLLMPEGPTPARTHTVDVGPGAAYPPGPQDRVG